MQVYKVTPQERVAIETLNESRKNILVIVCDSEGIGPCVVKDDVDEPKYAEYRKLLPVTLDTEKIVEIADHTIPTP